MNTIAQPQSTQAASVFARVLVGVDGSEESLEAARQAATLAEGPLTLLAVYNTASALVGATGYGVPAYFDEDVQLEAANDALARTRAEVESAAPASKISRGVVWDALLAEIRSGSHTLVAVGSHGVGRMAGIFLGSVATELVHKAPCSVLVARRKRDGFPNRIVVGVDGSRQSAAAYAVARRLAERFGVELWPVVATGGKGVDRAGLSRLLDHRHEELPDDPVTGLVAAAAEADLLVVGSRGIHGLKALGSVSERVAHRSSSSVLIVRAAEWDGEAA